MGFYDGRFFHFSQPQWLKISRNGWRVQASKTIPTWTSPPEQSLPWWRHQMETVSALLAFCAGSQRCPVNSPHKGQWRGALKFSLFCDWMSSCVNNREAGDLRRHHAHYDVSVMASMIQIQILIGLFDIRLFYKIKHGLIHTFFIWHLFPIHG